MGIQGRKEIRLAFFINLNLKNKVRFAQIPSRNQSLHPSFIQSEIEKKDQKDCCSDEICNLSKRWHEIEATPTKKGVGARRLEANQLQSVPPNKGFIRKWKSSNGMACFQRASPALKEILLKLYSLEKPTEIEHHLHEFGSVQYHVQSSISDPQHVYLSIATPLLSQRVHSSDGLSPYTVEMVKQICSHAVEIIEPAKEGYQLTLKIDFSKISDREESEKIVTEISALRAVILSSQLKEILRNVNSEAPFQETCRPIKLVYHPRESFYVIKQPQKILIVFPIRFKEDTDVIIATAFFRELMDEGISEKWSKAPPCCWSPIPPPELRGEPLEELSTNGGFVTFDISLRHVEGKRLDKTVWSLLNFNAYVKYHVKTTRGFIQRRMRKRLEGLVQILHQKSSDHAVLNKRQDAGIMFMKKLVARTKRIKQKCHSLSRKVKRIRFRIKIPGFARFRRRWLRFPKFSSSIGYTRLK